MTTEAPPIPTVTAAAVAAAVDRIEANGRYTEGGIVGIRAVPDSELTVTRLTAGGARIEVEACVSTLAVWDAMYRWDGTGWLVILTDRPEEDLGPGTLARMVTHRLVTPDPWEAAMQVFSARSIQRALLAEGKHADLSTHLVAITPDDGWPAAPGGVLTREHAYASIAVKYLGLPLGVDGPGILEWTARPDAVDAVSQLRSRAQDTLTDAVLGWLSDQTGPARRPVLYLLERGRLADTLPAGLGLHLLVTADQSLRQEANVAEARLTERIWRGLNLRSEEINGLGALCRTTVEELLARTATRNVGQRILSGTDALLTEISAPTVGRRSELLPSSLDVAYSRLGHALSHMPQDVEEAWSTVQRHPLFGIGASGQSDTRRDPAEAGVRLSRWLNHHPTEEPTGLAALIRRQSHDDAWADAAVNIAAAGVDSVELASGLSAVVNRALTRRKEHDRAFAAALSAEGVVGRQPLPQGHDRDGEVWFIEDLAREVIAPIARQRPAMVVLIDGMSTGAATQVLMSATDSTSSWTELVPKGTTRRASALAVLPTLTEHSRTSFFTGKLTTGGQGEERTGFNEIGRLAGHPSATLLHKANLESRQSGYDLSEKAADAVKDFTDHPLVGCVLNTIDDALDRSDPSGTVWAARQVKHLQPLLAAARQAGRAVIITADHGHVVERRTSGKHAATDVSSARSRASQAPPIGEGEVLVSGERVLSHGGTAVLAVDEDLRYSSVKAGYHGGGSAAEAVVPVAVLVPTETFTGDEDQLEGWTQAPTQLPLWWDMARAGAPTAAAPAEQEVPVQATFDVFNEPNAPQAGSAVVSSEVYAEQRAIAGRVSLSDEAVAEVLDALLSDSRRIPTSALASLLRIPETRVQFAVGQLQKLLNVEGYPVVRLDGGMLILDHALLAQQFGVSL